MRESEHKKSENAYELVRHDLLAGLYPPGARIDPNVLAKVLKCSQTPVRLGLNRLVGEGVVIDHGRSGLMVPLPTELALHDLYDWMSRLLVMACDTGLPARSGVPNRTGAGEVDLAQRTWHLFDAIGAASGHRSLHHGVVLANDRMAPIRHAKRSLIENAEAELAELELHFVHGDLRMLRSGVRAYHVRRRSMVPRIVALLNADSEPQH